MLILDIQDESVDYGLILIDANVTENLTFIITNIQRGKIFVSTSTTFVTGDPKYQFHQICSKLKFYV
jgi:hypothetical protein